MPTIKRKRPQDSPPGDYTAACDYCGVVWLRSRLKRDRSGLLRCPDEGDGLDQVTLSEGNAAATRTGTRVPPRRDGLPFNVDINAPAQHLCNWDQTPPEVVTLTPADDSVGADPSNQLVLEFDEVVARGVGNFELWSGMSLVASVDVQDLENVRFALEQVTITLPAATAPTTSYHVLVASGVVLNCNLAPWAGFQSATDWNWTTGATGNPTLLSSTPSDGATGVSPSADLQLVFSETVQPNAGTIFLKRFSDDVTVDSWDVTVDAVFTDDTVDLPLSGSLVDETQYYLEMASGVIEDPLGGPYAGLTKGDLEFTTGDATAPSLSSSVPSDGATGIDPTADIELTFNEDVQAGSGTVFLKRFDTDATVDSWDIATEASFVEEVVTLSPTGVPGQVQLYLEMASGVIQDLAGNAFPGLTKGALDFTTADVDNPTLVSSTPTDNATGVSVSTAIQLVFNEDVQAATGTIFLKRFSDDVTVDSWDVAVDVAFTGSTVDMTLAAPLAGETQYYLEIAASVIEDLSGNGYAGLVKGDLDFTTSDITAPLLLSSTPSDGATGVSVSTAIQLVFDEDVQANSGTVFLKRFSDDVVVDSWDITVDVTFTDDTVDMTLASALASETQYYLEIASGVIEDLSSNAYVGLAKGDLDFTTLDNVAPTLLSSTPSDGATDVGVSAAIQLVFDDDVQAGSGIIYLKRNDSDIVVDSWDVTTDVVFTGDTADLTLAVTLSNSSQYYLEMASGVIEDTSSNAFAGLAKGDLDFTTVALAVAALGTNVSQLFTGVSGSGTNTLSHTLVAGSNRVMRITILARKSSTPAPSFGSVTYGGVTAIEAVTQASTSHVRVSTYYVLEADLPADGANDIVLTRNFDASTTLAIFGSSVENAEQAVPSLTDGDTSPQGTASTSLSCNVTGITDGAWALGGFVASTGADPTWNEGQVEYFDLSNGSDRESGGELQGANGETSLSVSYASNTGNQAMVVSAFSEGGDPTDGLKDAADSVAPDFYAEASAASPGTVDPWPAAIGTAPDGFNTPTYNATGYDGGPSVDFVASDKDYFDLTDSIDVAAHSSDPNRAYWVAMKMRLTTADLGYMFGFGNPSSGTTTHAFTLQTSRAVGFSAIRNGGTTDQSFNSAGTLPAATDLTLVCAYRGNAGGGGDIRITYAVGGAETVLVAGTAATVLSAANYPITAFWFGTTPRATLSVALSARIGAVACRSGQALTNSAITKIHQQLAAI